MIKLFQIFCGLCWLLPIVIYAKAVCRVFFTDRWTGIDAPRTITWFSGVCQMGYVLWWLFGDHIPAQAVSDDLTFWAGLYVFNGLCALGFVFVLNARAKAKAYECR